MNLAVGLTDDIVMLLNVSEKSVLVSSSDSARYGAGVRKRVVNLEADESIFARRALIFLEPVGENLERLLSIVVVTVDDSERLVNGIFRHKNGMVGTPRLYALRVEFES